jgi:Ser/Thr protein kinase RdoA (MazF antagonist)
MEQTIRDRFSDRVLREAMHRYAIEDGQIRPLDAFESFIYEFERGPEDYILRISHSLRRSAALIEGEVDWINYLAAGGVSVARAVRSETGKLVEAIADEQGGYFLTTAFVKAQGQPPWDLWTPALYQSYGRLLGSITSRLSRPGGVRRGTTRSWSLSSATCPPARPRRSASTVPCATICARSPETPHPMA